MPSRPAEQLVQGRRRRRRPRRSSSAQVSEPRSSTSAVAFGARAADSPMPVIALAPWRRIDEALAQVLVRAHRRDHAAADQHPEVARQPPEPSPAAA